MIVLFLLTKQLKKKKKLDPEEWPALLSESKTGF